MRAKIVSLRAFALLAGAAAMLGAGAANAADVVFEEPPAPAPILDPAPVSNWSGAYIGLSGGYNFGRFNNTNAGSIPTNGALVGAFGGFQGQANRFVYGAEADIGWNFANGASGGTSTRAGLEGSLRGRAGVAVSDSVLLYGTAGLAATQGRITDAAGTATGAQLGYTVGAGTDVKFTEKVFGRLEYRWTDNFARAYNTGSGVQNSDFNNHRITVGLGVKF
jgi:outer membrane immunogenic protein